MMKFRKSGWTFHGNNIHSAGNGEQLLATNCRQERFDILQH
jgi:hypothetical protein